jgi:hypothetical protein
VPHLPLPAWAGTCACLTACHAGRMPPQAWLGQHLPHTQHSPSCPGLCRPALWQGARATCRHIPGMTPPRQRLINACTRICPTAQPHSDILTARQAPCRAWPRFDRHTTDDHWQCTVGVLCGCRRQGASGAPFHFPTLRSGPSMVNRHVFSSFASFCFPLCLHCSSSLAKCLISASQQAKCCFCPPLF